MKIKHLEQLTREKETVQVQLARQVSLMNAVDNSCLVIEFALNGKILAINDNYLKMFQLSREAFIGKYHADFNAKAKEPLAYNEFWNRLW
jgi:methyl-accepting chemotaxis protein